MTTVRPFLLLTLACACLTGQAWSADAKPARTSTVQGIIDSIDNNNTKLVINSNAADPAKSRTPLLNVGAATKIPIDAKPGTFADLKEQDQVKATFSQGTATSVAVIRDPAAGKATKK